MPQHVPDVPKPWKRPQPHSGRSYEIELITPMFGGGVETGKNDDSLPIRLTAIRGQLQFWWRATVGAQYTTLADLRAFETRVWGNTEQASLVQVRVDELNFDPSEPCARFERDNQGSRYRSMPTWNAPFNNTALPYALFPFQGRLANGRAQIEREPERCVHRGTFRLTVICHEEKDFGEHVEPALWAWVNFGGLGSRTRRGCGAVYCKELAPKDRDDLVRKCAAFVQNPAAPRDWPTLAAAVLVGSEMPNSFSAWDGVIKLLKDFRQGVGHGRNGENPRFPKRSRWPEPEAIRLITGQRLPKHQPIETGSLVAFPRAEFGLPVVFHFKDEDRWNPANPNADPQQTVLYPAAGADGKKRERMSSPLILKPLALQNGKAVPLILRLRTPDLEGVDLRRDETSLDLPPATVIRDPNLSRYRNSPLAGSKNGSAIEAFLAFARSQTQAFSEVTQ